MHAVKKHYDTHLGNFYSWMIGDFKVKQQEQEHFFKTHHIVPHRSGVAYDLGAGHGLQSVSLANSGFRVTAVDFNKILLDELQVNKGSLDILIVQHDLISFIKAATEQPDVIVCMGDTITHLDAFQQVQELIALASQKLHKNGTLIISFRDLTHELKGEQRFIPVKQDEHRILTCFLEFLPDQVMVHDILYENKEGHWQQKVSAYPKLRINAGMLEDEFARHGLSVTLNQEIKGMCYLIGIKN